MGITQDPGREASASLPVLSVDEVKRRRVEEACNDSFFADCGDRDDFSDEEFFD